MHEQSGEVRVFAVPRRQLTAVAVLVGAALAIWAAHAVRFGGDGWHWYLWNLWLAVIPLGLSTWLTLPRSGLRWPVLAVTLGCWLVFFPNAAYLVTDIVHLPRVTWSARFVVEAAMILLFGSAGASIALVSLVQVRDVVLSRLPIAEHRLTLAEVAFVGSVAVLNGFGIALGRLARSNSWDVWTAPKQLLHDVVATATSLQGATMTCVAAVLFGCAYLFAAPRLHTAR